MTQAEADSLKSCNGMGDMGNGTWLPYHREGDVYYNPEGLKVWAPYQWRPMTHAEIVAEMDAEGAVPWRFGRPIESVTVTDSN